MHPSTQQLIHASTHYPPICLTVHLPTTHAATNSSTRLFDCVHCSHQSIHASTQSSNHQSIHPFVPLAAHTNPAIYSTVHIRPQTHISTHIFTHSSTCPSVCLSNGLYQPGNSSTVPQSLNAAVHIYPPICMRWCCKARKLAKIQLTS